MGIGLSLFIEFSRQRFQNLSRDTLNWLINIKH